LLKVFSEFLDKADGPASYSILDSGSGIGVLGICAAGALGSKAHVRSQDRDELARIFTEYNARRNGLGEDHLTAHTEPLLAGPPDCRWDIILTNIPAKAGRPVLEDFIRRSAGLLKKDGRVFLVAVNTLANFFRSRITAAGAPLVVEESGKEHTVFVYGPAEAQASPLLLDEHFPAAYPFYIRNQNGYEMEDIPYRLDTVHGAPDFDSPGGALQAAAKLFVKIDLASKLREKDGALLIHDSGQGHFALWLARYLKQPAFRWVFSGRNVLALAAAKSAMSAALGGAMPTVIPAADIALDSRRIAAEGPFALAAFFPEGKALFPQALIGSGCILLAGMSSAEAERFDRKKPAALRRIGDIKRKGFRALAYQGQ